jgi:hypothetical protein
MPGLVVVEGATMLCAAGSAPAALAVTSNGTETIEGALVATIVDMEPGANIPPFGTCTILTALALGVPTPCVPAPTGPWEPGSAIRTITSLPVLTMPATCTCGVGGIIEIADTPQGIEESD